MDYTTPKPYLFLPQNLEILYPFSWLSLQNCTESLPQKKKKCRAVIFHWTSHRLGESIYKSGM